MSPTPGFDPLVYNAQPYSGGDPYADYRESKLDLDGLVEQPPKLDDRLWRRHRIAGLVRAPVGIDRIVEPPLDRAGRRPAARP